MISLHKQAEKQIHYKNILKAPKNHAFEIASHSFSNFIRKFKIEVYIS